MDLEAHVEREALEPAPREIGWGAGLLMLVAVLAGTSVYIALAGLLGIVPVWAGFVFALYWGGMLHADVKALPPALTGAFTGLVLAAGLHLLPLRFGSAGFYVALGAILFAVLLLLIRRAGFVVNNGTMLLLTIGTIPPIAAEARFVGMGGAILLCTAMLTAPLPIMAAIKARRTAPA